MSLSRAAFLREYLCRGGGSTDCNYLFLSDCDAQDPKVRADLIFDGMHGFLYDHVKITRDGVHYQAPDLVSFDFKLGWVLEGPDIKCFLGKLSIDSRPDLKIGHGTYVSGEISLHGSGNLEFGNFCCIASGSHFYTTDDRHPLGHLAFLNFNTNPRVGSLNLEKITPDYGDVGSKNNLVVGNNVWIARNATVKQGLSIGDGSVIAENAYINSSLAPFCLYGGLPAKKIKSLHDKDMARKLQATGWWYWSDEKILANKELFEKPLSELEDEIGQLYNLLTNEAKTDQPPS